MDSSMNEQHLGLLVDKYISLFMYDSARFYAERLYYENSSTNNLYYLAQCYFRQGKVKQTYLMLQNSVQYSSKSSKYLFALCCFSLNKLSEAEEILQSFLHREDAFEGTDIGTPGQASALCLLGKVCKRQNRKALSIQYFNMSLKIDPFMWSSITELSELGVNINIKDLYEQQSKIGIQQIVSNKENVSNTDNITRFPPTNNNKIINPATDKNDSLNELSRMENMENILWGGGSREPGSYPHPTSMSLGLSTMSLKIPFSSPSSIPKPSPVPNRATSTHSSPYPTGQILNLTADSDPSVSSLGDNNNYHQPNDSKSISYQRDPTATLFGLPTPSTGGITPIPRVGQSNLSTFLGPSSTDPRVPPSMTGSPAHTRAYDSSLMLSTGPPGPMTANRGSPFQINGGLATEEVDQDRVHRTANGRRVSFGATARLSFSSTGMFDPPPPGPPGHQQQEQSQQMNGQQQQAPPAFPQLPDGVAAGDSPLYHGIYAREDEHPHKLQRKNPQNMSGDQGLSPVRVSSSGILGDTGNKVSFGPNSTVISTTGSKGLNPAQKLFSPFDSDSSPIFSSKGMSAINSTPGVKNRPPGFNSSVVSADLLAETGDSPFPTQQQQKQKEPKQESKRTENSNTVGYNVAGLVVMFAEIYQQLCSYHCADALRLIARVPQRHLSSGTAQFWVAKAHYEMNQYLPAVISLRDMQRLEPFRVEGLELLSTALWHLKRDRELAALAQQVVEIDRQSPETWCVVGNCCSLQKEPEAAIRCFQKSIQLNPFFTYAYTLCGHELLHSEDMEKAMKNFRYALKINDRHYNAWYGLGAVHQRKEQHEQAEYHFRRALNINSSSSVLHCYLAMTLHAQGEPHKTQEALKLLEKACLRDKENAQLHFQRAHILIALDDLDSALTALHLVEEVAPREPPVHAVLGQVYHRRGLIQQALKHLNIAMDLDPKEAASLKGIIESINEQGEDDI